MAPIVVPLFTMVTKGNGSFLFVILPFIVNVCATKTKGIIKSKTIAIVRFNLCRFLKMHN